MTKKTPTSNYWERRFTAMDDETYKYTEEYIKSLNKRFERATRQMSKDMAYWYNRLAENNEISYAAAKQLLDEDTLDDFKITLEEYIKQGAELDLNPAWRKKLLNASAKVHISRLQELQLELQNTIENLYNDYEGSLTQHLAELVPNTYYHTAYELAKGTGVATTLHKLDNEAINQFLTKPWVKDGVAFSERIWARRDELVEKVNTELAQLLITGKDPQKAIDTIARDFAVEKSAAGRLVMTESAALNNEARRQCMKDLDVEEYEVVATLDSKTSAICRSMDGKHFPMSQFKIGLNAPPFHCNCRSCTVPYFNDEFTANESRAARDAGDTGYERTNNKRYYDWARDVKAEYGKIYRMDPNWEYSKWYKEVVEKKCKDMAPMKLQFFAGNQPAINTNTNYLNKKVRFGCKDITAEFIAKAKPGKGEIYFADSFTQNGVYYDTNMKGVTLKPGDEEKKVANWWRDNLGGNVSHIPTVTDSKEVKGASTPDFIIDGKRVELKTPSSPGTGHKFYDMIHGKGEQADNFIVDIYKSGISIDEAIFEAEKIFSHPNTAFVDELYLIDDDKLIKVLKRK